MRLQRGEVVCKKYRGFVVIASNLAETTSAGRLGCPSGSQPPGTQVCGQGCRAAGLPSWGTAQLSPAPQPGEGVPVLVP